MNTYRARLAQSPYRGSLGPQTSGCLPDPVANVSQVRLINKKRERQQGKEERRGGNDETKTKRPTKLFLLQPSMTHPEADDGVQRVVSMSVFVCL